ncbi:hypothetical protein BU24DRAFT_469765 [Aaosphaeria arxii CBS 175.79]|uniref:Uncharacterized protein n=1 Tax=Aaosphaeria arxii CBS 175.79 TaxID=1450172 RepID=A0A6A5Y6T2_9PLEO|nr:uncharacterized protein BU24DRAFT_469765 [Aaosphaeria arxii CBS 175.79]KAF2020999.1 hypothetical protein BU24DRAFT_469765 [Aaosphaeria arxii CBS 175.79]
MLNMRGLRRDLLTTPSISRDDTPPPSSIGGPHTPDGPASEISGSNSFLNDNHFDFTPLTRSTARTRRHGTPETNEDTNTTPEGLPNFYYLDPTVPSPYDVEPEESLECLLQFQRVFPKLIPITTVLLQAHTRKTNWAQVLNSFLDGQDPEISREEKKSMVVELLLYITRVLLPFQIAVNRRLLAQLYAERKGTNLRLLLRYDMLREWKPKKHSGKSNLAALTYWVESAEPVNTYMNVADGSASGEDGMDSLPPLAMNVIPTLIAAPAGGWRIMSVRDKMRHNVTALDDILMLKREQLVRMGKMMFTVKFAETVLLWQELMTNNEMLEDFKAKDWEGLGTGEANEWIKDQKAMLTKKEKLHGFDG